MLHFVESLKTMSICDFSKGYITFNVTLAKLLHQLTFKENYTLMSENMN